MRVDAKTINKLLELNWSGDTVITEAKYFPQFIHDGNDWVQKETYEVKYTGSRPNNYLNELVEKYFNVTLIWEDDIIPLIPYEE